MSRVIIIGGGPAGSTLGSYLSIAGIDNVILESANHPRPHVGESMVTSTTRIFDEIGFLKTMEREGFPRKYGASWHAPKQEATFSLEFRELPQPGIRQEHTYHVDRAKMDMLLLKHAESLGSKVFQGMHVQRVLFDGTKATGVQVDCAGHQFDMDADVVVDASGRQTLLGKQLKLKESDPDFNQFAVHAWFEGVDRGVGERATDIHVYFLTCRRGWVWQIPITDKITSIGVVAEKEVFKQSKNDEQRYFFDNIETNPHLAKAMKNATRINDFKREADYSYCMSTFVGDGFLCIGDAARFVDPIFSSGVSVALSSAKFAADRIRYAFAHGDFSEAAFAPYEQKLRSGVDVWYEFIRLYYQLLPLFTYFIRSKEHRFQVLQLLQGEVYDRQEVPVLDAMRNFIRVVGSDAENPLRGSLAESMTS
jgi:1H-pyrrole-2-carbonyl-[peptidyl-carrier protein] chlorinase